MKDEITNLIEDTKALKMSEDEKAKIKNSVFAYVQENPVIVDPTPSPFTHKMPVRSGFSWHFAGRVLAGVCTFVFIIGGAASGFAENSVPGDMLYSVKTNVNEPIVKGFSFGNEAKARAYASIAERRLVEIEKVSLDEEKEPEDKEEIIVALNKEFKDHADKVHDYVDKIKKEGKTKEARDVASHFETTLDVHANVLKEVDDINTSDESPVEPETPMATSTAAAEPAATSTENATTSPMSSTATTTPIVPSASSTAATASTSTPAEEHATTTLNSSEGLSSIISEVESQSERADVSADEIEEAYASSTESAVDLDKLTDERVLIAEKKIDELKGIINSIEGEVDSEYFGKRLEKLKEAEAALMGARVKQSNGDVRGTIVAAHNAYTISHKTIVLIKTELELDIKVEKVTEAEKEIVETNEDEGV